jgi:hypothetical protein
MTKQKKRKPRRKRPLTVTIPAARKVDFPDVKGKTLEAIQLYLELDDTSLCLVFSDNTQLDFDLEPGLTVRTELSDWKTGNRRLIKNWPRFERDSFWVKEPGPTAG